MKKSSTLLQVLNFRHAVVFYCHLDNENHVMWYGIERHGSNGVTFRWNLKTPSYLAILASLRTTAGMATAGRRLAYIPFVLNNWRQRSRWAALRFYPAGTEIELVRRCAFRALACIQQIAPRFGWLLESTGSGWQVWIIAAGYREWDQWIRLLDSVVSAVDFDPKTVHYDRFPGPETLRQVSMMGLRAPGAWNPSTDTIAEIHSHNLDRFFPQIRRRYDGPLAK
jgi:hypothetical protein